MSIVTINDKNLQNIGNAIRNKTGETKKYKPNEMADAISSIKGAEIKLQEKAVSPKTTAQTIVPDEGYDGMEKVNVGAVTSSIDNNIIPGNIKKGISILGIEGNLEEGIKPSGTKTITDNGDYDVTQYANASVNVPKGITPTGTIQITGNGTYDVTNFASAVVEVANGGGGTTGGKYAPRFMTFYNFKGVTELDYEVANLDDSNMTSMATMFYGCSSVQKLNLSHFTGENVTNTNSMFSSCSSLTEIDLRNFNPQNITTMSTMFYYCTGLTKLDLRSWDLGSSKSNIESKTNSFKNVPNNCLIICKDAKAVSFIKTFNSAFTNVKTLEEYQAEGGV